jgi:Tol biopolymer transport system component
MLKLKKQVKLTGLMKHSHLLNRICVGFSVMALTLLFQPLSAQYFGRNKPSYKAFEFKVFRTPHFDIYHYLANDSTLNEIAQLGEQWYAIHQKTFRDTFKVRNPIIIYADFSDFQQTTTVSDDISVGTGGVTEPLKNRVVIPLAASFAQTDHVLGHELVHAFQFHSMLKTDSGSLNNMRNLPLWLVEGMAEYFSIGSRDPNTSMWMRDAIVNNDFPTIEQMSTSYKYFPYRYGQCLMAMMGKTWGDSILVPIFRSTAKYGFQEALKRKLKMDDKTLSTQWKSALVNHYKKYLDIALTMPVGNKILFSKNAGDMNISPSLSPDGDRIIFLSEKDIFTFDLYLADAHTGNIIKKLSTTVHNSEIDDFNFIESAGTWSPDGKRFVFTIFAKGKNKLMLVDVKRGRIIGEYEIPGVPSFSNPAWSPVDNKIVVTGVVEGKNSLFLYDLERKQTTQLTHDNFSYMIPSWSSDGKYLTFATDKPLKNGAQIDPNGSTNLGILNVDTKEVKLINVFQGAANLNPEFSPDNKSLFFLSDRDGFRNLYKYSIDSGKVYQMTKLFTGITGITEYSPAISVSRSQDLLSYSYYYGGKYSIYSAFIKDFKPFEVKADSVNFDIATLPPLQRVGGDIVDKSLMNRPDVALIAPKDSFKATPYRPQFKLDYISNLNAGISTSRFGSGMAGSIFAIFSDISGQHQIATTIALNGQVYDFGAQVAFLNTKHKINWGASISHVPYTEGYQGTILDSLQHAGKYFHIYNQPIYLIRIFQDQLSLFAYRPISQTRRIELGLSSGFYYYRIEQWNNAYNSYDGSVDYSKDVLKPPSGYTMHTIDAAYVLDNSYFGMTAPVRGERYRADLQRYFGTFNLYGLLVDYRKYLYIKPYTIAFRALHYGRYGKDAEFANNTILGSSNQIYLGYPWYIRGYDFNTFSSSKYNPKDTLSAKYNDLFGSKIAVVNFEFRIPLTGPKKIALIKSNFLMTDFDIFCDAGIAWTNNTTPVLSWTRSNVLQRMPLVSAGASLRLNVLGALVIEPYYAFPFQYGGFHNPVFGINFLPGW